MQLPQLAAVHGSTGPAFQHLPLPPVLSATGTVQVQHLAPDLQLLSTATPLSAAFPQPCGLRIS
jgi:hypothetical protein